MQFTRKLFHFRKVLYTFGSQNTQKSLILQNGLTLQRLFSSKLSDKENKMLDNAPKDKVCALISQVVNQAEWSDRTETELDALNIELSNDTVLSVLETLERKPETALKFFKWVTSKTDFGHCSGTYNELVRVLGKQSSIDQFWNVVGEMAKENFQMDMNTYDKVLRRFLKSAMLDDAVMLFCLMMDNSEEKPSSQSCSKILYSLSWARSSKVDLVYRVVETVKKGNGYFDKLVYNGIYRCMVNAGRFKEAEGVFAAMEKSGFVPDNTTYRQLLFALSQAGRLDEASNIFEGFCKAGKVGLGCIPDTTTWSILIKGFCKAGKVDRVVSSFELMLESGCEADAEVLAVLVDALCHQGRVEDAHGFVCKMMEDMGLKPKRATLTELLKQLAREEKLPEALKLLKLMRNQGIPSFPDPFYELVAKSRTADGALQFLKKLGKKKSPSMKSYFSMLDAFCKLGKHAEALEFFHKCPTHVHKNPDVLRLLSLINAQSSS